MRPRHLFILLGNLLALALCSDRARAQGSPSVITYQGSLRSAGSPANGRFDFLFTLFDSLAGGTQIAGPVTNLNVPVTNGLFTTSLDFGTNAYTGGGRWLDISVRTNGSSGAFTPLTPRQAITAAPLAVFALTGNPGPPGPPGSAGTTGQRATTVYGTAGVTPGLGTEVQLSGLTQTINVPASSVAYIATDGGLRTGSTDPAGFSEVDVYLKIDGNIPTDGGFGNLTIINNAGVTNAATRWSISLAAPLAPGSHTIAVYGFPVSGSAASFSGGTGTTDQGELTVMILKQ
jgi:hypothetical protein